MRKKINEIEERKITEIQQRKKLSYLSINKIG